MKGLRYIWWICLLGGGLWAQTLHLPDGSAVHFLFSKKQLRTLHAPRIYYKNAIVANGTRFVDTRKIIVRFHEEVDQTELAEFAKRYRLKLLKDIGGAGLYLFRVDSEEEIITLCNCINTQESVDYARPNWHRTRRLH